MTIDFAGATEKPQGRKPEILTTEFVKSHGKEPRGVGHWAFATTKNPDLGAKYPAPNAVYWFAGPYSTARKAAQDFFRGKPEVYVLP